MSRQRETRDLSRLLWSLVLAAVVAAGGIYAASWMVLSPAQAGVDAVVYVQLEAPGAGTAIYRMPAGSRMRDLLRAARMPARRGDDGMAMLETGRSVALEDDGSLSTGWMAGDQMVALGVPIPLNECGLQDLVAIPGVGQATATRILKARLERGRWDSYTDLADASGIGAKTLAALRQYGRL